METPPIRISPLYCITYAEVNKRESHEGREILTAELKAKNVREFLDKLKAVGEIKEKSISPEIAEGNIAIRVEIVSNP
jgi:hypothetical protein